MLRLRSHDRKRDSCSRLMVFHIDCQVHEVPVAHHHESSHEDRDGVFSHQERAGVGLPADFAWGSTVPLVLDRPQTRLCRRLLVWTSCTVPLVLDRPQTRLCQSPSEGQPYHRKKCKARATGLGLGPTCGWRRGQRSSVGKVRVLSPQPSPSVLEDAIDELREPCAAG